MMQQSHHAAQPYRLICSALLLCTMGLAVPAAAADLLKERHWADQLENSLLPGEALRLLADDREFLAIYAPASGPVQRGAVILLHGMGAHPDWPDVIHPLRIGLPTRGWATLSLQLPVLPDTASREEYLPLIPAAEERVSAGIRYLQEQGIENIALLGHSLGAAMGADFLAAEGSGSDRIRAFVGIGMDQQTGTPDKLAKISLPVLDLYGSQDLERVLQSNAARDRAARGAGNNRYHQRRILGADHFFRGLDGALVNAVANWLSRYAPNPQAADNRRQGGKP